MENNHTIAAISTAMAESGIGIVRMSGEEALRLPIKYIKIKKEKGCLIRKLIRFITGLLKKREK